MLNWLTTQRYPIFLGISAGDAWCCTPSWEAEVVGSARRSSGTLWGRCPSVLEQNRPRKKGGRRGPISWPSSLPDLIRIDLFIRGDTRRSTFMQSPHSQDYRGPHGKTSGDSGNGWCQHVTKYFWKNSARRTTDCFLFWNGRRPLRTTVITTRSLWFDFVMDWAIWRWYVSWNPKVTIYICTLFSTFFF